MLNPIRVVCVNCLRSDDVEPDEIVETCRHCGGSLRTTEASDCSTVEVDRTPISLELSPDCFVTQSDLADGLIGPEKIGRYQVRDRLGGGGFGHVFRAYDPRLDREVALKILKEAQPSPRVMERFFREARAAAQLDHPSVVPLHDAGRDAGRCWIAYQYIPGPTLSQLIDGEPIPREKAARIVRELADGVHHAHCRGVFHRDIKPANVIVDPSGRPRLTDFGLARRVDMDPTLTREGTVLGTPAYMSPEQAAGHSHKADARSDVYSLGIVLHELICGRRPSDESPRPPTTSIRRIASAASGASSRLRIGPMPRALAAICRRALLDDPAHRYPDARAMAEDLGRYLDRRRSLAFRRVAGAFLIASIALATLPRWTPPTPLPPTTSATPTTTAPTPSQAPAATATPDATGRPHAVSKGIAGIGRSRVEDTAQFIGSRETRVYHDPACRHVARVQRANAVVFSTLADAVDRGFRPCATCLGENSAAKTPDPRPSH